MVLSNSNDLPLPLHWVAILYARVTVDFGITTGVHTHLDVLKALMAGANVAMITSELLQNDIHRIGEILEAMRDWMEEHEYESAAQMRGSMCHLYVENPANFERANYLQVLKCWRPDPTGRNP